MNDSQALLNRVIKPMPIFLAVYFVFLAILFTEIPKATFLELSNLGTKIIGFKPSFFTYMVYVYSALFMVVGYFGGKSLAGKRFKLLDLSKTAGLIESAKSKLSSYYSNSYTARIYNWFDDRFGANTANYLIVLLMLAIMAMANAAAIVLVKSIPLLNIGARWSLNPVLVWIASHLIFAVPALAAVSSSTSRKVITFFVFGISIVLLALLGARNLPIKLIFSYFFALLYVTRPAVIGKITALFVIMFVVVIGFVGAVSKSGIYGPVASGKLALALTYSDSLSTFYTLERIINISGMDGLYKGKLLKDSALSAIPGNSSEYSSYEIGRLLGGRKYFFINNEKIDRSVSLAPTIIGASYADWGVTGVLGQMLFLGLILGYLHKRAMESALFIPFAATFAAYMVVAVDTGIHNPHFILLTAGCLILIISDILFRHLKPREVQIGS